MKILAISDVVEPVLHGVALSSYAASIEAVISCEDIPFEYLEGISTITIDRQENGNMFRRKTTLELAWGPRDESVTLSAAKDDILRREGHKPRPPNSLNIYG